MNKKKQKYPETTVSIGYGIVFLTIITNKIINHIKENETKM